MINSNFTSPSAVTTLGSPTPPLPPPFSLLRRMRAKPSEQPGYGRWDREGCLTESKNRFQCGVDIYPTSQSEARKRWEAKWRPPTRIRFILNYDLVMPWRYVSKHSQSCVLPPGQPHHSSRCSNNFQFTIAVRARVAKCERLESLIHWFPCPWWLGD
jgi:hypothetical protein